MEDITIDSSVVEIPTSYTLENKLIYFCILEYLKPFAKNQWEENFDLLKFKSGLQSVLVSNFKYAFTKIDVILKEDGALEGSVQYTGGKVLTFQLHSNKF